MIGIANRQGKARAHDSALKVESLSDDWLLLVAMHFSFCDHCVRSFRSCLLTRPTRISLP
jgi:hypothetical protein